MGSSKLSIPEDSAKPIVLKKIFVTI